MLTHKRRCNLQSLRHVSGQCKQVKVVCSHVTAGQCKQLKVVGSLPQLNEWNLVCNMEDRNVAWTVRNLLSQAPSGATL
jgi:hypothetical protein